MSFKKNLLFFLILPFFQSAEVKANIFFSKNDSDLANLLDQYNKQETSKYDEYNECLKIWNKADYFDYYQYGKLFPDFRGPKFYIRKLPSGEEILFKVNPNYTKLQPNRGVSQDIKFWQRCHEPIREVPMLKEIVIGEVYPTFNDYTGEKDGGALQWIWKDESKTEILFFQKFTDGEIIKRIEFKKCPVIVDGSKVETSDEARVLGYAEEFERILAKYGHACNTLPLVKGDIN